MKLLSCSVLLLLFAVPSIANDKIIFDNDNRAVPTLGNGDIGTTDSQPDDNSPGGNQDTGDQGTDQGDNQGPQTGSNQGPGGNTGPSEREGPGHSNPRWTKTNGFDFQAAWSRLFGFFSGWPLRF